MHSCEKKLFSNFCEKDYNRVYAPQLYYFDLLWCCLIQFNNLLTFQLGNLDRFDVLCSLAQIDTSDSQLGSTCNMSSHRFKL